MPPMTKATLTPALRLMHTTPAQFTQRLAAMGEMWRWRWNTCGPGGESTIFSWIGDTEMRCAVGFEPGSYPRVKIAGGVWDAVELLSCTYSAWRCHILGMRGARNSDAGFLRVVWAGLDLPTAHVAPQPGERIEHCNEVR